MPTTHCEIQVCDDLDWGTVWSGVNRDEAERVFAAWPTRGRHHRLVEVTFIDSRG